MDDRPTGLGDEQRARRVVPRVGARVDDVVGLALDELRVVDAAAHPGQPHRRQAGEGVVAQGPHRGDADRVAVGRDGRAGHPLAVAEGAGPLLRDPGPAVLGLVDPRPDGLVANDLRHHDGMVGGAVDEVLRAVDGVDGEGVLGREVAVHQRVVGGEGLLAEDDGVGVGLEQPPGDDDLGLAVGDGHEVAGVLLHHLAVGERAEPGGDHLGGDLPQEVGDSVGRQAGHGGNGRTRRDVGQNRPVEPC